MSNKDESIIDMLKTMAADNVNDIGARLAACITYKGKIVSFGLNRLKSHPFQLLYGKNKDALFLHAEVDAIYRAIKRLDAQELSKSTLYVARVKRASSVHKGFINGLARPCVGCARCIATFGLKKVVYTTEQGFDIVET
jgi:tRNA(Arg) A34 adenosine deaminase TadA